MYIESTLLNLSGVGIYYFMLKVMVKSYYVNG